jgi:hypothetical protein
MGLVCVTHEGKRTAYRIFVRQAEGKEPLEICKLRWGYNIKIYIKDIELETVDFMWLRIVMSGELL